nr:MAG: ornithine carbamoyltransferase [Bacillota bacterium]
MASPLSWAAGDVAGLHPAQSLAARLSLRGRDFLSLHDWTPEELAAALQTARELKLRHRSGHRDQPLRGKTLGMIFAKASTRTRVSFEVGIFQLGGQAIFLNPADLQLGRGETIADTARVLSRYLDGIMIRTYDHREVQELARWAEIPVINGLTDREHPCQVLADLLTIWERKGRLRGLKLAFVGDGNNMAHSLLHGGAKFGMHVAVASPPGYGPDPEVVAEARADAAETGARITLTDDPAEAVRDADVVYTDVWASMGQEAEREVRLRAFRGYTVDRNLMALARPDAIFMHCLPAHRGEEVAPEVIDGPQSVVWDQAENRLHAQKAVMLLTMQD